MTNVHPKQRGASVPTTIRTTLLLAVFLSAASAFGAGDGDFDGNGYVGSADHFYFMACLTFSGPGVDSGFPVCPDVFDADADADVDLADFAAFQRTRGHLPIPLRDKFGQVLALGSEAAYHGPQTCAGACHAHDVDRIANGLHFQQGRTDSAGALTMGDDAFGDGRWWNFSRGRYGRWVAGLDLAPKDNLDESEIGVTSFAWIRDCSGCHVGGGPGEFDRDGQRYFDPSSQKFGFELLGKTWDDVRLDGDYSMLDVTTGQVVAAPWDVTGLSTPDCLFCHRADRAMSGATSMNLTWRQATLAGGVSLVNAIGNPVPAFEAAGTAAQGWFSTLNLNGTTATKLQIDYAVGVGNGSLLAGEGGGLSLAPSSFSATPTDEVCAPCHRQTLSHSGPWFDERDIHFAKFTNRRDADPRNDIANNKSTACNYCHPGTVEHNFAKGNFLTHNWRDELDWVDFRSCRECHLENSPIRHPDAPKVPGSLPIHLAMWDTPDILSCQACHIPSSPMASNAVFDSSVAAYFVTLKADRFYSADPLDPANPDKSLRYSALVLKTDSDGKVRLFPGGTIPNVYWADWDQNSTPDDLTDDTVAPVIAAQMRLLTGGIALPGVTDDSGDGKADVNRPDEILTYIQFLKGANPQGMALASRPVLVKGTKIWYEDAQAAGGVNFLSFPGTGMTMEGWTPFVYSIDHNVQPAKDGWGYDASDPQAGCRDCHRPGTLDSPVFDRLVLVDPFDENGQPVYAKVRELTGLNPP
ncbi:MAG: hypothetical protein AABZ12_09855 [Planctomycetota bacterium]